MAPPPIVVFRDAPPRTREAAVTLAEYIAAQVRKNGEQMEKICQAHPPAVNWGPVRPGPKRMAGLHPDHPNPKLNKPKPNRKPPEDLDLK